MLYIYVPMFFKWIHLLICHQWNHCEFSFTNKSDLDKYRHYEKSITVNSHLKVHVISRITENNYQCMYCDKPFLDNIQIKDNHLIAHAGEKIY